MDFLSIAQKFSEVIKCDKCRKDGIKNVLCDGNENIPQPGFIGQNFSDYRIVFIERNPGTSLVDKDIIEDRFNSALHQLASSPSEELLFSKDIYKAYERYLLERKGATSRIVSEIFEKTNLNLSQIAHFNLVRCRTAINEKSREQHAPSKEMRKKCKIFFCEWLKILKPSLIIFLSKGVYNISIQEVGEVKNYNYKFITGRADKKLKEKEIGEIVEEIGKIRQKRK